MLSKKNIVGAALLAAGIATLAACGTSTKTAAPAPASVTQSVVPAAPAPAGQTAAPNDAATPPTVAKTQGQVQILNGPATTPVPAVANPMQGSNVIQLNATNDSQIGTYVSDNKGLSLYRFDVDTTNPPQSNCNGSCAVTWPPLLVKSPGKIYTNGVDPSLVGYVERADGTCQVTINGSPVYYFNQDHKAGDLNGQGVKNTWFAVNPQGGKTPPITAATSSASGYGY